ncbi:MAG: DNA polymerase I [Lentisphaeria bacterium]|nr:DNA polymerase I [Lentisphaeria bacterium]
MSSKKRVFLLDGMALVYRAHFAFMRNPITTSKGFNTSAIYGYLNTISDLKNKFQPDYLAVAFDTKEPTFRHEQYSEYKANRDAMPEDLSAALPYVFEITEKMNIPILKLPGYEADDIIGTLAKRLASDKVEVYMVTPDKDYAQLVDENIIMYRISTKGPQIMGIPEILESWNIERIDQVVDILGLMGDSSDNIPGVPGVGPKTAEKLIAKYGTVEGVLDHVNELKGKQKEKFIEFKDQALLSKELVKIHLEVPFQATLDDLQPKEPNLEALQKIFGSLEMGRIGKRMFGDSFQADKLQGAEDGENSQKEITKLSIDDWGKDYRFVQTDEDFRELKGRLASASEFCFDSETTSLNPEEAEMIGLAFAFAPGDAWYISLDAEQDLLAPLRLDELKIYFEKEGLKIGHNLKYDLEVLHHLGIQVQGPFADTMLADYILDPDQRHSMDNAALRHLNYQCISISSLIGENKKEQISMREVPIEKVARYAAEDADVTFRLYQDLSKKIEEEKLQAVFSMENSLLPVLLNMQLEGIRIDLDALNEISTQFADEILTLETHIFDMAEEEFNIDSPKQLGIVLFEKMELEEKPKKTKTGQYATNEQVLQGLAGKHEIVAKVLAYRGLKKLKNTYLDKLPSYLSTKDQRIHTTFNQALTATGRISSEKPNLQNIPIRTPEGRLVRKAFIPRDKDHTILSIDYSQIELRIIASLANDENLIKAFKTGEDIHTETAAYVFGVTPLEVSRDMRSKAKMVNYGIAYGMSAFGLSQRLNISRNEAKDIIDRYFNAFPGIQIFMNEITQEAKENGYVTTLTGRRRYLRDINSKNNVARNAAERNAINSPIQGTAADMIKIAMVNVAKVMKEKQTKSRLLLQVHDELLIDMHKEEASWLPELMIREMEQAMKLKVPVIVDHGIGQNWLEAH